MLNEYDPSLIKPIMMDGHLHSIKFHDTFKFTTLSLPIINIFYLCKTREKRCYCNAVQTYNTSMRGVQNSFSNTNTFIANQPKLMRGVHTKKKNEEILKMCVNVDFYARLLR